MRVSLRSAEHEVVLQFEELLEEERLEQAASQQALAIPTFFKPVRACMPTYAKEPADGMEGRHCGRPLHKRWRMGACMLPQRAEVRPQKPDKPHQDRGTCTQGAAEA